MGIKAITRSDSAPSLMLNESDFFRGRWSRRHGKMAQCLIHPIIYEYDFSIHPAMGAWRYWGRHEIRVEAILTPQANQIYPVCVGGKGVCPPEDCGGLWSFMEKKQDYSVRHLKRAL